MRDLQPHKPVVIAGLREEVEAHRRNILALRDVQAQNEQRTLEATHELKRIALSDAAIEREIKAAQQRSGEILDRVRALESER